MTVGILGAGALGCTYGGYLHDAGESAHLIDVWDKHVEEINQNGLTITSGADERVVTPRATTDPDEVGVVDTLFVLVKATQTREALSNAAGVVGPETTVVTLQNGLKNVEILSEQVAEHQIVSGSTMVGATVTGPGSVRLYRVADTVVGGDDADRAREVVSLLEQTPLPASMVADPRAAIWSKQLVNVAVKPTAALTELPNGALVASEHVLSVMDQLLSETREVAAAAGIALDESDPLDRVIDACERTSEKHSSMLVDIEQERETEIDHINGTVAEYGASHGVATPYNDLVTALVHGKEATYLD
ncbi:MULTISPECIES: ketopantoate reductase family protein [Salinibaculum]|uniref:ketopantoate reductase family protein n=1 Tax=Salinibaculum TaxID=2732368 RepID=UPI0030D4CB93